MNTKAAAVFVSYSHDSPEHMNRVGELCDRLRAEGVDCHIDQYETSPAEGWPLWMQNQIEKADFILLVCTETYARRVRGREEPRKGLGVKWEGAIITQNIYESLVNEKFIPIVFSTGDAEHRPIFLRAYTYYNVETEEGYEALYRRLTNQPYFQKPQLGHLRAMELLKRPRAISAAANHEADETADELRDREQGDRQTLQSPGATVAGHTDDHAQEATPVDGRNKAHAAQIWIICTVLFASVAAVFIFAPDRLPEYKQRILALVSAVLSGALSFFLTGRITMKVKAATSRLGEISMQSAGGIAVFALVLWWWLSPLAPVEAVPQPSTSPTPAQAVASPMLTSLNKLTVGHVVYSVSLSRDGGLLAWSEDGGSVHLWQALQGNGARALEEKEDAKLTGHVVLSEDGSRAAAGSDDGKIRLWRTDTGRLQNIWSAYSKYIFMLSFGPDDNLISTGEDSDGKRAVRVWNSDGQMLKRWQTPNLQDRIIAVSPRMQVVAILNASSKKIDLWSYVDNNQLKVLDDSKIEVRGGDFSPDGNLFVAGTKDGSARLWTINDGRLLGKFEDAQAEVTTIVFHPGNQLISAGHADGSVYLWRVGETRPVEKLKGHSSIVLNISFSADGQVMASGGKDKVIQVWRVGAVRGSAAQ